MAIIAIILIAFIPMFIFSANTNTKTVSTLDSTYLGKDAMELAYDLSNSIPFKDLDDEMAGKGFTSISDNTYDYEYGDRKYLQMKFVAAEDNLVKVVAKVYQDQSMNKLEAQYETLYSWSEGGASGER